MSPERDAPDGVPAPPRDPHDADRIGAPTPSFEALYAEHVAFVFRTLRQLGVAEGSLEDAVQNVFLVVHRRLGEFEGRASIRTWLFRIVRRVASDARRSLRRRGASEVIDESIEDGGSRPDDEAERNEAARRLAALLQSLDEEKRAVFVLAELEQMTMPEIALALGVNVNTVGSRLRAARQAFEQALERDRRRHR